MLVKKSQKIPTFFECKKCDYITSSKKDFNKHTETMKHTMLVNASKNPKKTVKTFICSCGKAYCHESSYYRHTKTHAIHSPQLETSEASEPMTDKELVQYLLKKNAEFKQFMLEQNKEMIKLATNAGNNNNNTTCLLCSQQ